MKLHLILGGARSGKSRFAEQRAKKLAENLNKDLLYIATAQALDDGMKKRIGLHQARRDKSWQTIEEPLNLANALEALNQDGRDKVVLVDCLTLWLTNCLLDADNSMWNTQKEAFLQVLPKLNYPLLLVSNEVGQGIVPLGEINRKFVDEAGWLHQDISQQANKVSFMVAGLEQVLKDT